MPDRVSVLVIAATLALAGCDAAGVPVDASIDAPVRDAGRRDAHVDDVSGPMADVLAIPDAVAPRDAGPDAGPAPGYDVFVLAGQSNMVGRGAPASDPVLDAPHPEIWQWGRFGAHDGTIIPATARLEHNDTRLLDRVGMGLSFARAYFDAQAAPRPMLLVPTARGGTGFAAGNWNPGDELFEDTVARANAAMASHPGNRLVAILWHQGESDASAGYSTAQYARAVDTLIRRLRARIAGASSVPVVLGRFSPEWASGFRAADVVHAAIDGTPDRVPFTAVAPATGLTGNGGDLIHFDAVSQRAYGQRYLDALVLASANLPGAPPTPELRYTFDAGSAANTGSAGASADGTPSAGVSFVSDPIRGAVARIARPSGVIAVGRALAHDAYTISVWVQFTATTGSANIVSSTNEGVTGGAHYLFRTGSSPFVVGGAHVSSRRIVQDVAALPGATWAHYALSYDSAGAGTMRLYRDGGLVASASAVPSLVAPMRALFLGAASATGMWGMEGLLDDVRIYDRALTDAEVSDIHASEVR